MKRLISLTLLAGVGYWAYRRFASPPGSLPSSPTPPDERAMAACLAEALQTVLAAEYDASASAPDPRAREDYILSNLAPRVEVELAKWRRFGGDYTLRAGAGLIRCRAGQTRAEVVEQGGFRGVGYATLGGI